MSKASHSEKKSLITFQDRAQSGFEQLKNQLPDTLAMARRQVKLLKKNSVTKIKKQTC